MTVDSPTIDDLVGEQITTALTTQWFIPWSVAVGEKEWFATVLIQMSLNDDTQVQQLTDILLQTLIQQQVISGSDGILEQVVIWPSIGDYMKRSALLAIVWWLICMSIYILFAFAAMRQLVSPALLAVTTILTMLIDITFPAAMYALWMAVDPLIQVDAIFIIALLTVMGYSINDTIIIFDRVRENYITQEGSFEKGKWDVAQLFEKSIWQTMRRSIWTSLTTFLVVVAMYIVGTGSLKVFAFTFGMGVIGWSFSSIFFAAPLAYLLSQRAIRAKTTD